MTKHHVGRSLQIKEKRRYPRIRFERAIKLLHPCGAISVERANDLTLGGISLQTGWRAGADAYQVRMLLPDAGGAVNREIVLDCALVHCSPLEAGIYKLGMCIEKPGANITRLIKQYFSYKLNDYRW